MKNWSLMSLKLLILSHFYAFRSQISFFNSSSFSTPYLQVSGGGWQYFRGLFIIFSIDALIVDDEPLWEPLEWSLVQTWLFFIFFFAWIGENLISSRFGNYTGRDKRVWFAWYKSFWLISGWFCFSFGAASLFVITPFYYELTYSLAFIVSWWDWYTRVFFFQFVGFLSILCLLSQIVLISNRYWHWTKVLSVVGVINLLLLFLLYGQFISTFLAFFSDPLWYQKSRLVDVIQLSHEPLKWGWGNAKRDHFTYHRVSTSFWFKNDGPFAGALLLFQMLMFLMTFFLLIYWLSLFRRIYAIEEVSFTFLTYCVSALRQFTLFALFLYLLVLISFLSNYWRFPIEFLFGIYFPSWFSHFFEILSDYFFISL